MIDHAQRPKLTAAGERFVRHAEVIVAEFDDMIKDCSEVAVSRGGALAFEAPICFEQTRSEIESICAGFTKASEVNIRFVESDASLFDALENHQVDVGFTWSHPEFVEESMSGFGYTRLPVSEHPIAQFYMREDNPLASNAEISPVDLDGMKLVLPLSIRYSVFDEATVRFMQREGVRLRIIHKTGSYRDIELSLEVDEVAFSMGDLNGAALAGHDLVSRRAVGDTWRSVPYLVYLIGNTNPALDGLLDYVDALRAQGAA